MSTKGGIIDSAAQCHMGKIISEEFTSANDLKAEDTNNLKSEIELLRMESHHYKQLLFDAGKQWCSITTTKMEAEAGLGGHNEYIICLSVFGGKLREWRQT